ncbi:SDR family oxidoreductase [Ferrimicrobium sp.]|uniref:SDR family oxidoreductase n=2 Tax=Ferrimicrobium TaxID=121038 RepID=UPI002633D212|nr:SDR family oxidoreductase [Ferrimicrobium sp.]
MQLVETNGSGSRNQEPPGLESRMDPRPVFDDPNYRPSSRLENKVALITGGDSGIGRAVAIAFAKEGADVVLSYLDEHTDARETKSLIEAYGGRCEVIAGDIGYENPHSQAVIDLALDTHGHLDVLVNNAGVMMLKPSLVEVDSAERAMVFHTLVFSQFILTQKALPYLRAGSAIINTAATEAYVGASQAISYAAANGAIVSFTRSLALSLAPREIRVNAVAPGSIWTPLIDASISREEVADFGNHVPLGRPGQPAEVAPAYVFLACRDASYITGQVLHVNGGVIVNG